MGGFLHHPECTVPEQQLQGWEQTGAQETCRPFWEPRDPALGRYGPRSSPLLGPGHSPISFMGLWAAGSAGGLDGSVGSGFCQGPGPGAFIHKPMEAWEEITWCCD